LSPRRLAVPALAAAALAGCGGNGGKDDLCSDKDGAPTNAAFVFVSSPISGQRVSSGFQVSGCSSTFEGTVVWRLVARDGHKLASGSAQGGSQSPGPFSFAVDYTAPAREIGLLAVSAPLITNEGFPPVRNVIPLVLET
jgi:hypothetical protein